MRGGSPKLILAGLVVLVLAVFIADLSATSGVAVWLLYLPLCLGCLWFGGPRAGVTVSMVCSGLMVAALFFAPPGVAFAAGVFNRAVGITTLWMAILAAVAYIRHSTQLADSAAALRKEIAAHEHTDKVLREGEERLRLAAEAARFGAYDFDPQSGRVYWSPELKAIHGLAADSEITVERFPQFIHPDDCERVLGQMRQALDPRAPGEYEFEFRIVRSDGQTRWVLDKGRTLFTGEGAERRAVRTLGIVLDITERQQAEEALRHSERRFRALVDASAQIVWTADPDGVPVEDSPSWRAFTGLSHEQREGDGWLNACHPDDREGIQARWHKAITGRTSFEFVHRLRRHDGQWRWTQVRAVPLLAADSSIRGWVGMNADITERKLAEADTLFLLDLSECIRIATDADELMSTVAAALGEHLRAGRCGFIEIDLEHDRFAIHRDYHPHAPSLQGTYPPSAISPSVISAGEAGHTILVCDTARDERTAQHAEAYRQLSVGAYVASPLLRERRLISELIVAAQEPREWTEREATLIAAVAERTWLAVEKLRLDAALKESGERLRLATEAGQFGAYDFDPQTERSHWSPEFKAILGVPADAEITPRRFAEFIHPEDRERVLAQMDQTFDPRGSGEHELDFRIVRPDGQTRWVLDKGRTLFTGEGPQRRAVRTLGIVLDISERKRAEEALREADRRKDEFLATLAHELRNPLALIRNVVDLLQLSGTSQREIRWGEDIIDRQVDYLTRLTDDLFDVSRITRDKLELHKERVELAAVIHAAVESSRAFIDQRGHELSITLPQEPIAIEADRVRLAQVFMNLLNNAAKYTPDPGRIWLTAEREADSAVVRVKDTGMGIAAESLPHVFDLFYQVDRSYARAESGLGLGLTLVRRLIEMHGGAIDAQSAGIHQGSEFIVRLPILREHPAVEGLKKQQRDGKHAGKVVRRILVADDFPESATTLAKLLRSDGNEVQTAQDGREAFDTAAKFLPDVALLDLAMPNLSGYDAARLIRAQPWGKQMLLIALTGWGQPQVRGYTKEAGFDAHLTKPVKYEVLVELLTELSDGAQMRDRFPSAPKINRA